MKTLEDGWYIVINAYKFTVQVWRDFLYYHIHLYCMSALSLHIESTDSMIMSGNCTPGSTDLVDTLADSVCIH